MLSPRDLGVLFLMYCVEGLPTGLQGKWLPLHLRSTGVSLHTIGLLSTLSLPWTLKPLFAPFLDSASFPPLSHLPRNLSWILAFHGGLAFLAVVAWAVAEHLTPLLIVVFAMNWCSALLDVVVDGYAIQMLDDSDLGSVTNNSR